MNIVEPYAKIIDVLDREEGIAILRDIELFGRVSHRSEDAQSPDSWRRFIETVVNNRCDYSIVEHRSVSVEFYTDRGVGEEQVRHRLFSYTKECVSGDTRLGPSLTIREAHERGCIGQKIKSSDGSVVVKNKIIHIFKNGIRPVYSVVTRDGYRIKATLAHEFQVPSGEFCRLETLAVGDEVMVNGRPCLLKINDDSLRSFFFIDNLSPAEIAERESVPYSVVTRRLRKLGVFRWRRNDKDRGKYNRYHTEASYVKLSESIIKGYRNGRRVWNKGITEDMSESVRQQGDALRKFHHNNGLRENSSNWKGGVGKTAREEARRKKSHVLQCEVCGLGGRLEVHHRDENPHNNADHNLIKLCYSCHRKVHSAFKIGVRPVATKITSIIFAGWEEVFDLEMQTHHNYIANGFVVHNSTRFVSYLKKLGFSVIYPRPNDVEHHPAWVHAMETCESSYFDLLKDGWSPQEARSVIPLAFATKTITTGNLRNWRHLFLMRTTKETHPQMRQVMIPLLEEFKSKIPLLFEDIIPLATQRENLKKPR